MLCTRCPLGKMLSNGRCTGECPSGQYFDYGTMTCKTCGANCLKCYDGSSCALCSADSAMTSGKDCYFKCPPGTYYELTLGGPRCFNCHSSCKTCTGPTERECTNCLAQSLYSKDIYTYNSVDLLSFIYSNEPTGIC